MRPYVVDAWLTSITGPKDASVAANANDVHSGMKGVACQLALPSRPENKRKRRRAALSPQSTVPQRMPISISSYSSRKMHRTTSPKRRRQHSPESPTGTRPENEMENIDQRTPRAARQQSPADFSYASSYVHALAERQNPQFDTSMARTETERSSQTRSTPGLSQSRASSPTKRIAHLMDINVHYKFLNDSTALGSAGRELFNKLLPISENEAVIPRAWQSQTEELARILDLENPSLHFRRMHFDDGDNDAVNTEQVDHEKLANEARCIAGLIRNTARCEEMLEHEAEWNMAVHGRVLDLAFGTAEGCNHRYMYVCSSKLSASFVDNH